MDGFLLAFKEKGISSNQVVQQTKRLFSLKKVGHLGTLDPMAEGLLVLAVNRASRAFLAFGVSISPLGNFGGAIS